jgi:hypothetical protein
VKGGRSSDTSNWPVKINSRLLGAKVSSIGRALDLVVLSFDPHGRPPGSLRLHVQCPSRLIRRERILIGSRDLLYAAPGGSLVEPAMFDQRASVINGAFQARDICVQDVVHGIAGYLRLVLADDMIFEVFPDASGNLEAWRLVREGGEHLGFPERVV